jgi:protein involved in polysaccharide export with SLBB domain
MARRLRSAESAASAARRAANGSGDESAGHVRRHGRSPGAWEMNDRRRGRTPSVLLALAAALAAGCASTGKPLPDVAGEINATLDRGSLALVPGDSVDVRFVHMPDWNHEVRVRPDGRAAFLLLGDMDVIGLDFDTLRRRLEEAYGKDLQQPDLSVLAHDVAPRVVIVQGEVHRPGDVPITNGRLTLIEAIGKAGGPLKETAYLEDTILLRWLPKEKRQVAWKIDASVDFWGNPTPIYLQPFDVIFIPNKPIDRVDIFVDQYIRRLIPLPVVIPVGGNNL